jgi:hypothetical protein
MELSEPHYFRMLFKKGLRVREAERKRRKPRKR